MAMGPVIPVDKYRNREREAQKCTQDRVLEMKKDVIMCDIFKKCRQYLHLEKCLMKTDEMYGIHKDTSV